MSKKTCTFCETKFNQTARKKYRDKSYKAFDKMISDLNKKPNKTDADKELVKSLTKTLTQMKSPAYIKSTDKIQYDHCNDSFCNNGCKGTIMEKGAKLPAAMVKKLEQIAGLMNKPIAAGFKNGNSTTRKARRGVNKQMLSMMNEKRKRIFAGKTDVLVDNFYEGLSKTDINKLKKAGAISGCVEKYVEN